MGFGGGKVAHVFSLIVKLPSHWAPTWGEMRALQPPGAPAAL